MGGGAGGNENDLITRLAVGKYRLAPSRRLPFKPPHSPGHPPVLAWRSVARATPTEPFACAAGA